MNIDSFEDFLKNVQKVSESTIKHYSGAIETISKDCNIDLYKINDINELKETEKSIIENDEYIKKMMLEIICIVQLYHIMKCFYFKKINIFKN